MEYRTEYDTLGGELGVYDRVHPNDHASMAQSTNDTIHAAIHIAAVCLFPRLVPSTIDLANSLTVYNASSTPRTLTAMLVIALIGMPIVVAYTAYVYKTFAGKMVVGEDGY